MIIGGEGPMADDPSTIYWKGKSGASYKYWILPIGIGYQLKPQPGNYIFAKETEPRTWHPIYVGETGDLSRRFGNYHQDDCISRNGATHIHAHVNIGGDQARHDEETDIRHFYNPSCNKQ
jgi:hypothetical protein